MTIESVCILDAGGQFTKVIDRRLRELNVHCVIRPASTPISELSSYKGIVISGGPSSVGDANAPKVEPDLLFKLDNTPILGICWGMQFITAVFGGQVKPLDKREDGVFDIDITEPDSALFKEMEPRQSVLLTHGDSAVSVPDDLKTIAKSGSIIAAVQHKSRPIFGVQFHPEVDLTANGVKILSNFVDVCGCERDYTDDYRDELAINEIKAKVGESGKILVLVSGGVDSSVLAALCYKAVGVDRVKCIHIDNGFMRLGKT